MRASKHTDVTVTIHFPKPFDWYEAHTIREEGLPDVTFNDFTMWGWIAHLRDKNWWNSDLEEDFIRVTRNAIKKYVR